MLKIPSLFTVKLWLYAIRPHTLSASVAPSLLSQTLAYQYSEHFSLSLAALALSCALALQIAVNLANDYFDDQRGIDDGHRLGPEKVLKRGDLNSQSIKRGFYGFTIVGVVLGVALSLMSYWPLMILGLCCVAAVFSYSGGPRPLASMALGEVAVFVVFGPVAVLGGFYLQAGFCPPALIFAAVPMGLLAAAIMLVNNIRDLASDTAAGKKTLAFYLGEVGAKSSYALCLVGSIISIGLLAHALDLRLTLAWACLPVAMILLFQVTRRRGSELNRQLAQTAQFKLLSSCLLCSDLLWFAVPVNS